MADKKISQLTDGTSLQSGDFVVVARSGNNFKVDPTQFSDFDLTAISTTIADTAVDVFVYDTSRDSDGGAWRHRTQHTSWYNETLNTAFRGSRREFPAVAVIVAENDTVTIYDGDDPSLPMWMVFKGGGSTESTARILHLNTSNKEATSCSALNGILCVSAEGTGVTRINLISDKSIRSRSSDTFIFSGNISERNELLGGVGGGNQNIVDDTCNDVAMTVLPNAPIDAATGLPVPTIAVATDGGVSVIKDDGTVVDITSLTNSISGHVTFDKNNHLYGNIGAASNAVLVFCFYDIPESNVIFTAADAFFGTNEIPKHKLVANVDSLQSTNYGISIGDKSGSDTGFVRYLEDKSDYEKSAVAEITSTYNTGWMNGDIKLATLSDTDDTDVTGSELVTNGTFDTDITGWSTVTGTNTWDAGTINIAPTNYKGAEQDVTVNVGSVYLVSVEVTATTTSTGRLYLGIPGNDSQYLNQNGLAVGTYTFTVDPTSTTLKIRLASTDPVGDINFDNVSVRLAEPDRSVNGNGLQVYGTITKDPVATGADLVAYGGFSVANYLEQPYNSDLDFGTGDFCIMGWFKTAGSSGAIFYRAAYSGGYPGAVIRLRFATSRLQLNITDDGFVTNDQVFPTQTFDDGVWHKYAVVRRGTTLELWLDGSLLGSTTISAASGSLDDSSAVLTIGQNTPLTEAWGGSLALFRISATAPTAEQIAKIYEDEKFLFQEGAQATLYGASDAVTALAHDEVTDLLHVGTSAGRSVFQGLRRVDNTTDAVGVAISAYDGLVAED